MTAIFLVSHFHWDREWYRTFEEFRARLVDAIDRVLDLSAADPGFRFMLDGQTIVLDDYVDIRPERRDALRDGIASGRLGAGPWYVQPDSLLPAGETHVRNLLVGRAIAESFGACSRVAYVPDSFGHPAQFPQLFAGFGLDGFIYWRGNPHDMPTNYAWYAPDGSVVRAWYLAEGYFAAGGLDADGDVGTTADRLAAVIERFGTEPILLMNGFDHLPPDATTAAVAAKVGAQRVLLDDTLVALPAVEMMPPYRGELVGARNTNVLPGVWSSRIPLKLANRHTETLLTAWVEPWAAFGHALGLPDERPSLDRAWRLLLQNQAHDSIGGCSIDAVHTRMMARYDDARGLGHATLARVLERLSGRNVVRDTPWIETPDVVVYNASPEPRTDVVRVPLDGFPPWRMSVTRFDFHPLSMPGFTDLTVDGRPARVVRSEDPARVRFLHEVGGLDLEFIARDVPAYGCRRYKLATAELTPEEDDGNFTVLADDDGTLTINGFGGLFAIEDCVDRGDSYDADCDEPRPLESTVWITRARHVSGIEHVTSKRETSVGTLTVVTTSAPGVPFVRCAVTFDNRAPDHRLRLRFPTGAPIKEFDAASTFDRAHRTTTPVDDTGWVHQAPSTFVQQGWIAANGLVVGAPGLPEAEVTSDGDILITLVRSVGALARLQLRTRPMPAAPDMPAPGAQVIETVHATITIATNPRDVRAAEVGLFGVLGGETPVLAADTSLLELDARTSELSTCKPAQDGDGVIVRVLNTGDELDRATLRFGLDIADAHAVRLDESQTDDALDVTTRAIAFEVRPHALRTVRVRL